MDIRRRHAWFVWTFAIGLAIASGSASAAVLTAVGADVDNAPTWRSTSVAKPLDIDGNNVFGTDGYALFMTNTASYSGSFINGSTSPLTGGNSPNNRIALPGYVGLSNTSPNNMFWSGLSNTYPNIDDPALTPGPTVADIKLGLAGNNTSGSLGNLFNLTFNSATPAAGVRVGVLARHTDGDSLKNLTLTQTVGGSSSAVIGTLATGSTGAANVGLYFFDITGINAGDVFTLSAQDNGSPANNRVIYGMSFDTIPEPATVALLGMGGLLMFPRRRSA